VPQSLSIQSVAYSIPWTGISHCNPEAVKVCSVLVARWVAVRISRLLVIALLISTAIVYQSRQLQSGTRDKTAFMFHMYMFICLSLITRPTLRVVEKNMDGTRKCVCDSHSVSETEKPLFTRGWYWHEPCPRWVKLHSFSITVYTHFLWNVFNPVAIHAYTISSNLHESGWAFYLLNLLCNRYRQLIS